ncbi:alkaline phosphatase family protein [Roseibium sp. MMSF_3412]|uniref:alkaline phosphatase family protein n=1 Tax=Roseibium sp. MMSF_3412 TaxID=3046712 RepID=UPI00273E4027|nr:alkaline phosphatase family protein [Roseibium sp. MMSF_3412]
MTKVCLIVIDGLRDDTARAACHYLMSAVAGGDAQIRTMRACLPTISAPLYETLHTGRAPKDHGLMDNKGLRPSSDPSVFSQVKAAGGRCGVVGHCYFHTLFGGTPFDAFSHAEITDPNAPIAYARYYSMDGYDAENSVQPAEIDLCAQAWLIADRHVPEYLLLHTSSCDTLGHAHTGLGRAYFRQAEKVDAALAQLIPRLLDRGYHVLVTSDHGMDEDGNHGGDAACLRHVPFLSFAGSVKAEPAEILDQRSVAPTILALLGISRPATMAFPAFL